MRVAPAPSVPTGPIPLGDIADPPSSDAEKRKVLQDCGCTGKLAVVLDMDFSEALRGRLYPLKLCLGIAETSEN